MAYNYKITEPAEKDLDEILNYIAIILLNPTAAKSFYLKLSNSIENICEFPEGGAKLDNGLFVDDAVRKVIIDNYLLHYKIQDEMIYILRIIYGKRNLAEIISLLNSNK